MYSSVIFLLGIIITIISYYFLKDICSSELCTGTNYRGNKILSIGGIHFLFSIFILASVTLIISNIKTYKGAVSYSLILIIIGFAFLGLIDDLLGNKDSQGFKGHIRSLLHGRLTTGGLKLFGGPIICILAFMPSVHSLGYLTLICDVIAISLIANLTNLFDLAPGRSLKISIVVIIFCLIFSTNNEWQYGVLGILAVLLYFDLKEMLMLGDIGSNSIGAMLGFSIVNIVNINQTYIVIAIALVLNLLSEFVSFSLIINKFIPFRILDTFGQSKERKIWLKKKLSN
ncbi:MAG: hypothetical protein KBF89_00215 [Acidimicrobiia bacterium]|nr:hypothetical protein [Acidimicrobiia bacterium]